MAIIDQWLWATLLRKVRSSSRSLLLRDIGFWFSHLVVDAGFNAFIFNSHIVDILRILFFHVDWVWCSILSLLQKHFVCTTISSISKERFDCHIVVLWLRVHHIFHCWCQFLASKRVICLLNGRGNVQKAVQVLPIYNFVSLSLALTL